MVTSELTLQAAHTQFTTESSPRVALYARVSTKDKGQDYINQLNQLRDFAARQGWTIVIEFCDTVSAAQPSASSSKQCFRLHRGVNLMFCCSGAWTGFPAKVPLKPYSTCEG